MLEAVLYQMTTSNVSGHMYAYMQPLSLLKCPSNYTIYIIFWGFQLLISLTVDNTINYIDLFSKYLYARYIWDLPSMFTHIFSSDNEFMKIVFLEFLITLKDNNVFKYLDLYTF